VQVSCGLTLTTRRFDELASVSELAWFLQIPADGQDTKAKSVTNNLSLLSVLGEVLF